MQTNVVLTFDRGHPTRLTKAARLASMLAELGAPQTIEASGPFWRLEWSPIFPGVPIPFHELRHPWPGDGRTLQGVHLG